MMSKNQMQNNQLVKQRNSHCIKINNTLYVSRNKDRLIKQLAERVEELELENNNLKHHL